MRSLDERFDGIELGRGPSAEEVEDLLLLCDAADEEYAAGEEGAACGALEAVQAALLDGEDSGWRAPLRAWLGGEIRASLGGEE